MSLLRRATWGVLVLLLALPGCRKREEGPEGADGRRAAPGTVETEAVAADLPAGAAVVVSVHDLQSFWTRVKATQLYTQLRAIPEIQSALDPAQNPQLANALQQAQATLGMPLNEQTLFKLVGKKIQIGVYASPSDTADQRVVLVADMGDKDALASVSHLARRPKRSFPYRTENYR